MITENEIVWLEKEYPNLKVNPDRTEVKGVITFTAAYDFSSGEFTPLTRPGQTTPGKVLTGKYDITIKKPSSDAVPPSLLVHVEKTKRFLDRHFYGDSERACLCGPTEAIEFMRTGYSFPRYLEQLVFPFLYGQTHYDSHNRWPWSEYPHGSAGMIESYYRAGTDSGHATLCVRQLQADEKNWPRLARLLSGGERMNGTVNCVCGGPRHKLKDHAAIWFGVFKLKNDIARWKISIALPVVPSNESEVSEKSP